MSKPRALVTTVCLTLSAAAVIAAAYFEAAPARASARRTAQQEPAAPAPAKAAPRAEAPGAGATLASTAPAAAPAPRADHTPSVTIPDWKGKRLSVVRREGRRLGLVVSARDDYGQRVSADVGSYYRVKRQLTEAGTTVEPGAGVEVRVREIEAPSGY